MNARDPIRLLVIGAGNRGQTHSLYAEHFPEQAQVVGVAEPREFQRNGMREKYSIPQEHVFTDWREAAKIDRFADAVVIATQDQDHCAPTVAFADLKYNILLEKPMAVTEVDCTTIRDAITRNGVILKLDQMMLLPGTGGSEPMHALDVLTEETIPSFG